MVSIAQYGPVLDYTIAVARGLTQHGQEELRVPLHLEASGMAVDVLSILSGLDPYIDVQIYPPRGLPYTVRGKDNPVGRNGSPLGVERYTLRFIFENKPFEMPDLNEFSSYPYETIIDLDDSDTTMLVEKARVIVGAKNTVRKYSGRLDPFISALRRAGIGIPEEIDLISLHLSYQTVADIPINAVFQHFERVGEFSRKQAKVGGYYYPVSVQEEHKLDYSSWDFFHGPIFWDSWSQYSSIAFNKMAGTRSYEEAARYYSMDLEDILRHAASAEGSMIDLIHALIEGGRPEDIADKVKCPVKYRGVYLSKLLKTFRFFCNPNSLKNSEKREYLENLAVAVSGKGFTITPEELAVLSFNR